MKNPLVQYIKTVADEPSDNRDEVIEASDLIKELPYELSIMVSVIVCLDCEKSGWDDFSIDVTIGLTRHQIKSINL